MGMYTELFLQVGLKSDTPKNVIDTLNYMLGNTEEVPDLVYTTQGRMMWMLQSSSFYHYPFAHSHLDRIDYSNSYYLFVRCDLKNYSNEIEEFLDFISPHVDGRDCKYQGHYLYEGSEFPTRLSFHSDTWFGTEMKGVTQ
jgi:hypothetical protein